MKITAKIRRKPLNTIVIIVSLTLGLACINLISMFINHELHTDDFHKDSGRIYSLLCDDIWTPGHKMNQGKEGSAEYMANNFSQVESYCRIRNATPSKVNVNNEDYYDRKLTIASSGNFFEFFSYQLLTKNPKSVLSTSNDLVISEELAKKYFGFANPVGQIISFGSGDSKEDMIVTGVFKKPNENTQLNFDMVRLGDNCDSRCYVKLKPKTKVSELEKLFAQNKEKIPVIHKGNTVGQYYLMSLHDSYFDASRRASMEKSRDKTDLWIALVIGMLILIIGLFNYLVLLNNQLLEQQRNLAIRKINGGSKFSFVTLLMKENLFLIFLSFILSIPLMLFVIAPFNRLIHANLSISNVFQCNQLILDGGVLMILGSVACIFVIVSVNKRVNLNLFKGSALSFGNKFQIPAINIFQLSGSIVLIIGSIVMMKQISFINNKPIGLNKEVIEVKIPAIHTDISNSFKNELLKNSNIESVSVTTASPLLEHFILALEYDENGVQKNYSVSGFIGDENYLSVIGTHFIQGEGFSDNPEVNKNKVVVNKSFADFFKGKDLIGNPLPGKEDNIVIGVVDDFHYNNLKSVVEPAIVFFNNQGCHLMVKPVNGNVGEARKAIASVWSNLVTDFPLNTETIGERYEWMHRENTDFIQLIGSCCLISIFLSMIGLFAVAFQTSKKRTKEIGIRKVNGAKIFEVMTLLNKSFVSWVIIAFVIATPIAWYVMNKWLQSFAYKTDINWWIYALGGFVAFFIVLLTVSWQSWRAATKNPVEALRYE